MEPFDYVRTVISRWRLVFATTLVAASIAWFTSPADAGTQDATSYTANAVLVRGPGSEQSVSRIAVFVTSGDVPARAAEKLGYEGSPAVLADRVEVTPDETVGTLTISVTDTTADDATRVADEFVAQTIAWMRQQEEGADERSEEVKILVDEVTRAEALLTALSAQVDDTSGAVLQTKLAAAEADYTAVRQRLSAARAEARAAAAPLQVVQDAVAVPDSTTGFAPPSSRLARTTLAALGGLALGIVLALVVSRIDTRLRSRAQVQAAYGLPVLSEIPNLPWWRRPSRRDTVVLDPTSEVTDAYRPLRSAISLTEPVVLSPGHDVSHGLPSGTHTTVPQVIVVVSARSGEGRTTVAVTLAACLAESGKRVLVIDADVERPRAHQLLGVPAGPGLTDVDGKDVTSIVRASVVPGVRLVQSGAGSRSVALMPLVLNRVVEAAREMADVVVIDCPPLLGGTEAMDAMATADAALVVCRAGRTSREDAERAQELLARVRVPVFGVALFGTSAEGSKRPLRRVSRRRESERHSAQHQPVARPGGALSPYPAHPYPGPHPQPYGAPTGAAGQPGQHGLPGPGNGPAQAGPPVGQPAPAQPAHHAPEYVPEYVLEYVPEYVPAGGSTTVPSTEGPAVTTGSLPVDRVGAAEAMDSSPSAGADPARAVSQLSPPRPRETGGDQGAMTPHGAPWSGEPSRPAPASDEQSDHQSDSHVNGQAPGRPHGQQPGPADLRRQAQVKRRKPSSGQQGRTNPRRVGQPRSRGDR